MKLMMIVKWIVLHLVRACERENEKKKKTSVSWVVILRIKFLKKSKIKYEWKNMFRRSTAFELNRL